MANDEAIEKQNRGNELEREGKREKEQERQKFPPPHKDPPNSEWA